MAPRADVGDDAEVEGSEDVDVAEDDETNSEVDGDKETNVRGDGDATFLPASTKMMDLPPSQFPTEMSMLNGRAQCLLPLHPPLSTPGNPRYHRSRHSPQSEVVVIQRHGVSAAQGKNKGAKEAHVPR